MSGNMRDIQDRLLKDAAAQQVTPEGFGASPPKLLFDSVAIDVLRGTDPVSGQPICNLLIRPGNNALQVIVPLPAAVTAEMARAGIMKPATIALAEQLAAPDYLLVRRRDAGAAAEAGIGEPDGAELRIEVDEQTAGELSPE